MTESQHGKNPIARPLQGQIGIIDFDPSTGKEIQKRRPALVISTDDFNKLGFCTVCPITHTDKPIFVEVPDGLSVDGFVNPIQYSTVDWRARNWKFQENCPEEVLHEVQEIVASSIFGEAMITRID